MSEPAPDAHAVRICALHVYPLKSGQGIARETVRLKSTGLEWDRHWMAIDTNGKFLSQRTHPRLARIRTQLGPDALTLEAPDVAPLVLPLERPGAAVDVQVWDDRCLGVDQGEAAAHWIAAVLEAPARLVRVPPAPKRRANPGYAGPDPPPLSFADGYQILVCNRASLDDLNTRMDQPVPMERFRPNIVLEGLPAFAEDRIAELHLGPVVLRLVKPCARCVITSTDQHSGERSTNPLPVLRTYRFDKQLLGVTFGENAVPVAGVDAELRVGSPCRVVYEAGASAA